MTSSRIEALRNLLEKNPQDATTRYMLANELYRAGELEPAIEEVEAYLRQQTDEGAAYRILADAYLQLGKKKQARWAFRQGIEAAKANHHAGMAEEYQERLDEMDERS